MTMPWRPAAATGVGSMPGTSAREAARIVAGELPDLIHVVELPDRGPGSDMIGRTGAMLTQVESRFGLETTPDGWRIAGAGSRQMRLAHAYLGEDLDALEETTTAYAGPVKVQLVGPLTFAAAVELRSGERALRDPGAMRDIAEALALAAGEQVGDIRRRVPHASSVLIQWDEPGLPAVLEGRIGTASGLSSYAPVDPQQAERLLATVLAASGDAVSGVHCCAEAPPVDLLRSAGASFISIDITGLTDASDQAVGRLLESGGGLLAGSVPTAGSRRLSDTAASAPVRALLHRLGLEDDRHLAGVAISPTCGLAGASPAWARAALEACAAVGRVLRQDETGGAVDGQ